MVHSSKAVALAAHGGSAVINSAGTFVKVEPYGSLDKVAGLFTSLSGQSALASKFGWLLTWPALSDAEKRARYSAAACHEVHVWLFFKDHAFFVAVVAPLLACKRAKTFVDHWLLGDDLTPFHAPGAFSRLNAFETALLAARSGTSAGAAAAGGGDAIARFLADAVEAAPTSVATQEDIFRAALASDGLSSSAPEPIPVPVIPMAPPSAEPFLMMTATRSRNVGGGGGGGGGGRGGGGPMPPPPAPSAPASRRREMAAVCRDDVVEEEKEAAPEFDCDMPMQAPDVAELAAREAVRNTPAYRPLSKTEEYAEAGYHGATLDGSTSRLVAPCEFWADFAAYCANVLAPAASAAHSHGAALAAAVAATAAATPFVSPRFGSVGKNVGGSAAPLTDMLLALAVLGLPLERDAANPPVRPTVALLDAGARVRYTAGGTPLALYYQDLATCAAVTASTVLCGQNYFDPADRHVMEGGNRREKYLRPTGADGSGAVELLAGKVYSTAVVITNISPEQQQLEVLLHIPRGALPASNGFFSRTQLVDLAPFATRRLEYQFYFPRPGTYGHFPVHVGAGGELLAHAGVAHLRAVRRLTSSRDLTSWAYVAAEASMDEVVTFLATANLDALPLASILWRATVEADFVVLLAAFRARAYFYEPLWAYGFRHGHAGAVADYLARTSNASRLCTDALLGPTPGWFASPLVTLRGEEGAGSSSAEVADVDAVVRGVAGTYQHLEYSPLVNARAHVLGTKRKIMNAAVSRQYRALLTMLCLKPPSAISSADLLATVYHLLLQDRVREALQVFASVPPPPDAVAARFAPPPVVAAVPVPAPAAARGGGAAAAAAAAAAASTQAAPLPGAGAANWATLQYDYLAAYLDFFAGSPAAGGTALSGAAAATAAGRYTYPVATAVAAAYAAYPVPKWADKFAEVAAQLAEAAAAHSSARAGGATAALGSGASADERGASKELSREAQQAKAAAREPSLELAVEGGEAVITYANLAVAQLRFYAMDVELLFSTSPFLVSSSGGGGGGTGGSGGGSRSGGGDAAAAASLGQFAFVRPNGVLGVVLPPLPAGKVGEARVPLPAEFAGTNVMVEATSPAASIRRAVPYFANRLGVAVAESYGRLKVTHAGTGAPLPRTYVKVYYRTREGETGTFYKDGYTDLRGMFDYTALSTDELSRTQRFALLIVSDAHGSTITTAAPPRA